MTLEEVTFQMDLLGHDFFLFKDGETEEYNLLYRRRDGDYGLIQPEPL
jgi:putative sigma-54 modulation protein